ncbi:glycolate oxidase [Thermodesulfobium acidiphilum]|uniref:Glycolate oxidase n=1 Tax=Thermodesulfobium acidiphilum TaxID=1794699 RepID=A0A2R4W1X4_THEAF|nr:glycolate oxidase [Thermodesulfobium acidiphilum]
MLDKVKIKELTDIVGDSNVLVDESELMLYSYDATQLHRIPDLVVIVHSPEEVSKIIKFARKNNINVYPRGSGTNLSGGSIPVDGGIVIELNRLNRIIDIDVENRIAIVEPGVIAATLDCEVAKKGLFYPPDPGSLAVATIGGCVCEGAGGLRALKYGTTKDYIIGLEVVLPNGDIITTGSFSSLRGSPGFDLTHLFVGSEGTLGIVTKIAVKLIYPAKARKTFLVLYDRVAKAGNAVAKIIENKIIPSTMEFLDKITINAIEDFKKIGLPRDIEALLLIEVDGEPEDVEASANILEKICIDVGARSISIAKNDVERLDLMEARRAALPVLARLKPTTILEDATVPRSKVSEMLEKIHGIQDKYNLMIGSFGHAGDGNLHPTILVDRRNKEEMKKVDMAIKEIFDYCIELGGTLTGEHGIGIVKAPFMENEFKKEGISFFRDIKKALDPDNKLNPNKIVSTKEVHLDYI